METVGSIFLHRATVNGDVELKGAGTISVTGGVGGTSTVSGNIKSEGPGLVSVLSGTGSTVTIGGSVENKGGGLTEVLTPGATGTITIDGDVCGTTLPTVGPPPDVTVNGSVKIC